MARTFSPYLAPVKKKFALPCLFSCKCAGIGDSGDVQTAEHPTRNAQTAAQAYAKAQTDAANHIASIRALLKRHAKIQADESWNWGFVGDLGKINETLAEIRRQLR